MKAEKYETIESTHKYLKENQQKYMDKTAIIANMQTEGIGTKGRNWFTGSNKNIAISVLYRPICKIEDLNGLTVKIAKILQRDIYDLYNVELTIKMPNDLMLNGKKICGILTEVNTIGSKINYLIISVGFNVNEIDFPKELENVATSLKKEIGREFDKNEILKKFIETLENLV